MPARRINITLAPDLHDKAQEYCAKNDLTFSALVTFLLRDKFSLTEREPSAQLLLDNDTAREVMVSFFKSEAGRGLIQALLRDLPLPAQATDHFPKEEEVNETRTTPPGNRHQRVEVKPELLKRMDNFTNGEIISVAKVPRSILSKVRRGVQPTLERKTYETILEALETLEGIK